MDKSRKRSGANLVLVTVADYGMGLIMTEDKNGDPTGTLPTIW